MFKYTIFEACKAVQGPPGEEEVLGSLLAQCSAEEVDKALMRIEKDKGIEIRYLGVPLSLFAKWRQKYRPWLDMETNMPLLQIGILGFLAVGSKPG